MEKSVVRAVQRRESEEHKGHQQSGAGRANGWRSELRGMDFAAGQARLAPEAEPGEASPRSFGHWLQTVLNRVLEQHGLLDRPLQVDGIIGAQTRAAIKAFQRGVRGFAPAEKGVPIDGAIGPVTLGALQRVAGEVNPFGRAAAPAPVTPAAEQTPPEAGSEPATATASAPAPSPAFADGAQDKAEQAAAQPESAPPAGGAEQEMPLGPPPEVVAKVHAEVQAEQAAANKAAEAPGKAPTQTKDLETLMKERLESARLEMGMIKEKEWFTPPPFLSPELVGTFQAKLDDNKSKAGGGKPAGVWFAKDQHSLDRLKAFALTVQLEYEKTAIEKGYQWCGSFIASHYGMTGTFEFVVGQEKAPATKGRRANQKKEKATATADGNMYLASTSKSYKFFNYEGEWSGAYIRDLAVPSDAPVEERYKPIVPYHLENGGTRAWYPIEKWKSDPQSVVLPGMVLFVKGTDKYGKHMIFVDYVEEVAGGGWVVHTVEGNAPGAKSAPGKYPIGRDGKTEIRAVAKPSPLDFDTRISMLDKDVFTRKLREESGA